jgi:hypothetical protein
MLSGDPKQVAKTPCIELLVSAMLFNPTLFVPFRLQDYLYPPHSSISCRCKCFLGQHIFQSCRILLFLSAWVINAKFFKFSFSSAFLSHITMFSVVLMYLHGPFCCSKGEDLIGKAEKLRLER